MEGEKNERGIIGILGRVGPSQSTGQIDAIAVP